MSNIFELLVEILKEVRFIKETQLLLLNNEKENRERYNRLFITLLFMMFFLSKKETENKELINMDNVLD